MSNNLLRIITAVVGIPLVLGLTYVGGWPFTILVLVIALLAQFELYQLLEATGLRPDKPLGLFLGGLMVVQVIYPPALPAALALFIVAIAISPLGGVGKDSGSLPATVFGVVYPTFLLAHLLEIRLGRGPTVADFDAFVLTVVLFLIGWATDTFAYYVGRSMGRRPLAPAVSPKKTWEGAIGGTVGAVLVGVLLKVTILPFMSWVHVLVLTLIVAVVGQLGDLAESKMKRAAGVKDSGKLLPGHGGMLDRFDALILAAPAAYLYLRYVAGIIQ
ncbi:MAG: phosphatidate cytidylyltransferase [Rhodothermales bacterium]